MKRRLNPLVPSLLLAACWSFRPAPTSAATLLTVDLGTKLRPVTHVGSGSLYGVLEKQPADVEKLIAPLKPNVLNNPAADVQQPIGDAIVVAGRVASIGTKVTIRLADWLPGWPYGFTTMKDWLDKVGQTVSRRKAANLTNIYAYEIWNEPNGTWQTKNGTFNDLWKQTYQQLRQQDPTIKITGPSTSYYDSSYIQSFLSFCKTNDCLPDIIGWHELSGGNVTSNIQSYRNMEKQLGIGPLPITINEYSGKADLTVEGQPGASASLIAKFERLGVESACISFWDVSHPGRLGSLLATNTDPNGGWWFYKWYGDMAGDMVSTTPANAADSAALDGFANLDTTAKSASVLLGGVNDGSVHVVIKGLAASKIFGSTVHVVVERTPFVNRTTVVKETSVVSTSDVAVTDDQLSITIPNTNNADGFRISLTPVGGAPSGTGGSGGGAAGGRGGGTGGAGGGTTGGAGRGGAQTGGSLETGGHASGGRSETGGASSATGGRGGQLGSTGGAGPSGTGGATSTGGNGGPITATGGTPGTESPGADTGCACNEAGTESGRGGVGLTLGLFVVAAFGTLTRRRRSPRRSQIG